MEVQSSPTVQKFELMLQFNVYLYFFLIIAVMAVDIIRSRPTYYMSTAPEVVTGGEINVCCFI